MVISMVIGITAAVMSAARILPSSRNRTTITSSAAFEQVLLDRPDRPFDEIGAVVDRHGLDARRERPGRFLEPRGGRARGSGCSHQPA
jgi:hypothetical protein